MPQNTYRIKQACIYGHNRGFIYLIHQIRKKRFVI
jgi:hypothetical protein